MLYWVYCEGILNLELCSHCVYVCRYLYCVQLCDDIRRNRVRVDRETAIRLTALMLQGTGCLVGHDELWLILYDCACENGECVLNATIAPVSHIISTVCVEYCFNSYISLWSRSIAHARRHSGRLWPRTPQRWLHQEVPQLWAAPCQPPGEHTLDVVVTLCHFEKYYQC